MRDYNRYYTQIYVNSSVYKNYAICTAMSNLYRNILFFRLLPFGKYMLQSTEQTTNAL